MAGKTKILSTAIFDVTFAKESAEVTALPFISVEAIEEDTIINDIKGTLGERLSVIFTSANAVKAVVACSGDKELNWQVYSIGNSTATAVRDYLRGVEIVGTAAYGAVLAEVIKDKGVKEVVFFCGDKRLGILPARLSEAGVRVRELEVYRTIETPKVVSGDFDGVLFFSPSAVNSFFSLNKVPEQTVLFAIGTTTAGAIKEKTTNKIIVCETQSKEDVLRQAIQYFKKEAV